MAVKEMLPAVKPIYVTMNPDADVAAEAFARGASGYFLKTCAAAEMVLAVQTCCGANRMYHAPCHVRPCQVRDSEPHGRRLERSH